MTLKRKSYALRFKSLDTPAFKKDIDDMIKNLDQNVTENKKCAIVFGPDNISRTIFKIDNVYVIQYFKNNAILAVSNDKKFIKDTILEIYRMSFK